MKSLGLTLTLLGCTLAMFSLNSCSSQLKAKERYVVHRFDYGKSAYIGPGGKATAPPRAPRRVKRMINPMSTAAATEVSTIRATIVRGRRPTSCMPVASWTGRWCRRISLITAKKATATG